MDEDTYADLELWALAKVAAFTVEASALVHENDDLRERRLQRLVAEYGEVAA